jgi:hypothetical protein
MEVIYHEQSEIVEKLGQIESELRQVKDNVQQLLRLLKPLIPFEATMLDGSSKAAGAGQAVKASTPIDFEDILPQLRSVMLSEDDK